MSDTKHDIEQLKVFAGNILSATKKAKCDDYFLFQLHAMAEYIMDVPYPNPTEEYQEWQERSTLTPQENTSTPLASKTPELTEKQEGILYIIGELQDGGYPITLRRISAQLREPPSHKEISDTLDEMMELGIITKRGENGNFVLI